MIVNLIGQKINNVKLTSLHMKKEMLLKNPKRKLLGGDANSMIT